MVLRLLRNLTLFLVIQVLTFETVSHFYDHTWADHFFRKSVSHFENRIEAIDVLFTGDSRIFHGINPEFISVPGIDHPHNISFPSESIQATYYKLRYYLQKDRLANLKVVVLMVDWEVLTKPYRIRIHNEYPYARYYDYRDILSANGPEEFLISIASSLHIVRLAGQKKYGIPPDEILLTNGYRGKKHTLSKTETATFVENYDEGNGSYGLGKIQEPNPLPLTYYRRTIDLLEARGIRVILLSPPNEIGYYLSKDRNKTSNPLTAEMLTHFPNVPLLDYQNEQSIPFDGTHYSDGSHLNNRGSEVFGAIVSRDLTTLLSENRNATQPFADSREMN